MTSLGSWTGFIAGGVDHDALLVSRVTTQIIFRLDVVSLGAPDHRQNVTLRRRKRITNYVF